MAKLSISQAWDETRAILARDGQLIAAVALALFVLPGMVLSLVAPQSSPGEMPQPGWWIPVVIAVFLVTLAGQLSVIRLALGPHITVGEAIVHGARRVLPYIAAFLIWTVPFFIVGSVLYNLAGGGNPARTTVVAAIALLAFTVAGIFIAVRLILLSAVASAESGGPIVILQRTWRLTDGNWWRLFGFIAMFIVGAMALIWATASVLGLVARLAFGELSPLSVGGLIVIGIGQLVSAAISVVLFVMVARLYAQRAGGQAGVPRSGT